MCSDSCHQALEAAAGQPAQAGPRRDKEALPFADGQALAAFFGEGPLPFQHQHRGEGGLVAHQLEVALHGVHREVGALGQMAVEVGIFFGRGAVGDVQRLPDVQLPGPAVRPQAAVVVDAVGDVGVLLGGWRAASPPG